MIGVCTGCMISFDTTEEDANTPGVKCPTCYRAERERASGVECVGDPQGWHAELNFERREARVMQRKPNVPGCIPICVMPIDTVTDDEGDVVLDDSERNDDLMHVLRCREMAEALHSARRTLERHIDPDDPHPLTAAVDEVIELILRTTDRLSIPRR